MRVALSAYSCEPGRGSEPGAGWQLLVAAARLRDVDVVLFTRPHRVRKLRQGLDELGLAADIIPVEGQVWLPAAVPDRIKHRVNYALWQRRALRAMLAEHTRKPFDIAHHATFASDSARCAVSDLALRMPTVIGPVGGYVPTKVSVLRVVLTARGLARELVVRAAVRASRERNARRLRASLVVAQNDDVARFLKRRGVEAVVRPNVCVDPDELPRPEGEDSLSGGAGRAVFVGHSEEWKGWLLSLRALSSSVMNHWTLEVFGYGDWDRARAVARRLGVSERVRFRGEVSRSQLFVAMRSGTLVMFPSVRDSAGWSVAEAGVLGVPVVVLGMGGPPVVAAGSPNATVVVPLPAATLVDRWVEACLSARRVAEPVDRWGPLQLADDVMEWYAAAIAKWELRQRMCVPVRSERG